MRTVLNNQRAPESGQATDGQSKFDPENVDTPVGAQSHSPVTSSPGEEPYVGSHADNYDPDNTADRNVPENGPSGENTKNGGERGGGLWTSGGTVTTGTAYHDEDDE
jgi:hypothetical protein